MIETDLAVGTEDRFFERECIELLLFRACISGATKAVKDIFFVAHNDGKSGLLDVNVRHSDFMFGSTALGVAASNGFDEIVAEFLKFPGVKTNLFDSNQNTPLHSAMKKGHNRVVKLFIKHKETNLLAADERAYTPLMIAIETCNYEAIVYFVLSERFFGASRLEDTSSIDYLDEVFKYARVTSPKKLPELEKIKELLEDYKKDKNKAKEELEKNKEFVF